MPQYASYPAITSMASDDKILVHDVSVGAERTITYDDFIHNLATPFVPVRAVVHLTADESIPDAVETTIPWDAVWFQDASGMWGIGDPTRLKLPSYATKVRVTGNVRIQANATGSRRVKIKSSNAAGFYPLNATWSSVEHQVGAIANSSGDVSLTTPIIDITLEPILINRITDFTITVEQTSGIALNVLGTGGFITGTSLCLEVLA